MKFIFWPFFQFQFYTVEPHYNELVYNETRLLQGGHIDVNKLSPPCDNLVFIITGFDCSLVAFCSSMIVSVYLDQWKSN